MAAQSFAMGLAFGTSFQYGKRKISSMSNEEFNRLTPVLLHGELQSDIRSMIPSMNRSFQTMEQFQLDIINSMFNTIKEAGSQFFNWITTGKTGTETTTFQTDTQATNVDFSGGTFEVQGGSRTDLNQGNDRFLNEAGQTYEEWLAFNKTPEIITKKKIISAKNKKALTKLAIAANKANQVALTAPKVNVRVIQVKRSATSAKEQYYINKKRIQTNISTIKKSMNAARKNYQVQSKYAKTRRVHSARLNYMRQMAIRLNKSLKSLNQALVREERLLRNYRRNP